MYIVYFWCLYCVWCEVVVPSLWLLLGLFFFFFLSHPDKALFSCFSKQFSWDKGYCFLVQVVKPTCSVNMSHRHNNQFYFKQTNKKRQSFFFNCAVITACQLYITDVNIQKTQQLQRPWWPTRMLAFWWWHNLLYLKFFTCDIVYLPLQRLNTKLFHLSLPLLVNKITGVSSHCLACNSASPAPPVFYNIFSPC